MNSSHRAFTFSDWTQWNLWNTSPWYHIHFNLWRRIYKSYFTRTIGWSSSLGLSPLPYFLKSWYFWDTQVWKEMLWFPWWRWYLSRNLCKRLGWRRFVHVTNVLAPRETHHCDMDLYMDIFSWQSKSAKGGRVIGLRISFNLGMGFTCCRIKSSLRGRGKISTNQACSQYTYHQQRWK